MPSPSSPSTIVLDKQQQQQQQQQQPAATKAEAKSCDGKCSCKGDVTLTAKKAPDGLSVSVKVDLPPAKGPDLPSLVTQEKRKVNRDQEEKDTRADDDAVQGPENRSAWKGFTPQQSSLPLTSDATPDYSEIDSWFSSQQLFGAVRNLLAERAGEDSSIPGYAGMVDIIHKMHERSLSAEVLTREARAVFEGILPYFGLGWAAPAWKNYIQAQAPDWATNYSFVLVFQSLFPWLMGPMAGGDEVELEVPYPSLSAGSADSVTTIKVPQTLEVERCRLLEGTQCASICVNACKVPSQEWFKEDFGMDVHIEPNYEDFSCKWKFGKKPPPLEEDEAVMVPCFKKCPSTKKGQQDARRLREHSRPIKTTEEPADSVAGLSSEEAGGQCFSPATASSSSSSSSS